MEKFMRAPSFSPHKVYTQGERHKKTLGLNPGPLAPQATTQTIRRWLLSQVKDEDENDYSILNDFEFHFPI